MILRPYILDLVPRNGLVEYLLEQGFEVYLLDWGTPGNEDKNLSFDHYVLDYLPEAVANVSRSSRAEGLTLFGYCQGGTMAVMYAALFPGEPAKNLVLLATPVDVAPEDPGLFGLWTVLTSEKYFDPNLLFDPDPMVEAFGNVPADLPGRLVEAGTPALKPSAGYAGAYARLCYLPALPSQTHDGPRQQRGQGDARHGRRARGPDGEPGGQGGTLATHRGDWLGPLSG